MIKKIIRIIYINIGVKLGLIPRNKGCLVLFTGLPCSGKTSTAKIVYNKLKSMGNRVVLLDGDKFREAFNNDLSFTVEDIHKNIKRLSAISNMLSSNGVIVLASFISPFKIDRERLKNNNKNFIEIHVACSKETCMKRDTKIMWKKAEMGLIDNFIGIDVEYEQPDNPNEILFTEIDSIRYNSTKVIKVLKNNNII